MIVWQHPTAPAWTEAERKLWDVIVEAWKSRGCTARLAHCLANAGCETIADTLQLLEREWMRQPNFGRKTLHELRDMQLVYQDRLGGPLVLTYGEWIPGATTAWERRA